jgi:hypothetical protein
MNQQIDSFQGKQPPNAKILQTTFSGDDNIFEAELLLNKNKEMIFTISSAVAENSPGTMARRFRQCRPCTRRTARKSICIPWISQ